MHKYPNIKLKEILTQVKDKIEIVDDVEYAQVTVSNTGNIILRGHKLGATIGTKKQTITKEGWFIYSRLGVHQGSYGFVPKNLENAIVTGDMPVFILDKGVLKDYLLLALKRFEFMSLLEKMTRGAAQVRIREKYFLDLEIPLPSLKIQEEIVNKIYCRQEYISGLGSLLVKREEIVSQFRQAILQEAVQGKLVPQDPKDEPASELLKRIKAEKEKLIKEKKIKKEKPLPPILEDEIPYELPNGWVWVRLGDAGLLERGKSKHRPRNDNSLFKNGLYPFVQTGDVSSAKSNGGIISTFKSKYNEVGLLQSRLWNEGTLCITIAANIAETGFLGLDACFPDSVVAFTSLSGEITKKYVKYYLDLTQSKLEEFAPSTAQKNINLGILNALLFPLPPLDEQKKIVDKINQLFELSDMLNGEIQSTKKDSENLMQAVLQEAFAG